MIGSRYCFVWFLCVLAGCNRDKPVEPAPITSITPIATPSSPSNAETSSIRYIERMMGGADKSEHVPIVLAIHGYGDRPESFGKSFDGLPIRARLILPYALFPTGDGFFWFPLAKYEPRALAEGMRNAAHELSKLLTDLEKSRPTRGKPIVTGFSQGGMLSFALAVLHPEQISEALPVAGLLAPPLYPATLPMGKVVPPLHAFHGDADDHVPIEGGRDTVRTLANAGYTATLIEYPNVQHYISSEMRRDWLTALDAAVKRAANP